MPIIYGGIKGIYMKYSKIALGLMTILLSGAIAPVATSASSHTTIPKAMREPGIVITANHSICSS